ncbi:hypothetical protein Nmel_013722, partial [Mimus melanotis]
MATFSSFCNVSYLHPFLFPVHAGSSAGPGKGQRGGSWNQSWKTSTEKRDVAQLPLLVNHGTVLVHLLHGNPCWFLHLMHHSSFNT